jgi:hypothetical protein
MSEAERYPYPKLAPQPDDQVYVWIEGAACPIPAIFREDGNHRWFEIEPQFWAPRESSSKSR